MISETSSNRLAILLSAPHPGDTAMHNDSVAMYRALRQRDFQPEEIWTLEGTLTRSLVLALLTEASHRISSWNSGSVFLYYTGHGAYQPSSASDASKARPGMMLQPTGQEVLWAEALAALRIPPGVSSLFLPDC